MSANKNPCETPPGASDFQSNMTDLLEKMGASQQCKTSADSFFDSGSSSSGSNLQSGSSSNKMNSSMDTSLDGQTTSVLVEGPKVDSLVFSASTGKIDTTNTYSTSKTSTDLSTEQKTSQLNLTEQQAAAFSKGASKMASEGCGTVVLNATKISNTKKNMNCFLKSRKYESSVDVKIGNSIYIRPVFPPAWTPPAPVDCAKFTSEKIQEKCLEKQFSQDNLPTMNISGARLTQKANATVKTKISLSESDKKTLVDMQKEIANNIVEGKLTSDNKLDALPPSAKDIITRDETIDNTVSNTSIEEKTNSAKISMVGENEIIIEYSGLGNFDGSNLVIDQDAVATMLTEILFTDSVEAGVSASQQIEDTFKKETGMSLSAAGESEADRIRALGEANRAAIEAGQAGVNAAAANQVAVDAGKLAAGNADMNRSNADVIDSAGEANKGVVKQAGENQVDLNKGQFQGIVDVQNARNAINWGAIGGMIAGGAFFVVIIGMLIYYKLNKKKGTPPPAGSPSPAGSSV